MGFRFKRLFKFNWYLSTSPTLLFTKSVDHIVLHEVVAAHFEKPHSILWFLHNWEVLLNRKLDVFAVAQKLNMYLST